MFSKLFGRKPTNKVAKSQDDLVEKVLGLSKEFQDDLEIFLRSAVGPAKDRLWSAFQNSVGEVDSNLSRTERRKQVGEIYKDFVGVLPDFAATMGGAGKTVLAEWLTFSKNLECEELFLELIDKKISERRNELFFKSTAYLSNFEP